MSQTPAAPLVGVRVLDLSRLLPGGYASQMLADLGADVLKIEEPGLGDYARTMPPFTRTVGQAFLAVNRDKRSVALNLKHPDGREALLRLVDGADALLESYRPGVMARLGLDYATLHARNPRLVVCSISGYGQDGPYSQRAGHDLNYIGYAGLLAHLARPGEPPVLPGAQFADIAGGSLMAVSGMLAALVGRATTGEGRYIDVSMTDGALSLLPILGTRVLNGTPEPAPGEAELTGRAARLQHLCNQRWPLSHRWRAGAEVLRASLPAPGAARSGRAPVPPRRRRPRRDDRRAGGDLPHEDPRRVAGRVGRRRCLCWPGEYDQRGAGRSPTAGARHDDPRQLWRG